MPKWVGRVAQVTVAVAALIVVWRLADGGEALQLLAGARPAVLLAAGAVLTGQIVLSARRWQLTAGQLGIELRFSTALTEYYLSQLVNQVIPGGVIGDAGRAVRARQAAGLMASGQSVLLERVAGQAGLFVLLATGFALTTTLPGGIAWPPWALLLVSLLLGGVLAVPFALRLAVKFARGRTRLLLADFIDNLKVSLWDRSVRWHQIWLSLATAIANVAGFTLCAYAVGANVPLVTVVAIVPLILLTMLIPVTISGWGLREGAAAGLFLIAGLTSAEGLATSVAFGVVLLVIALPGLAFVRSSRVGVT